MAKKVTFIVLAAVLSAVFFSCSIGFEKSRISRAVREYVEPGLPEGEKYDFVGTFNRRDTVFMGVTRPCAGVIYNVVDMRDGHKTRHCVDVIFSNDYGVALHVTDAGFDPVDYVGDKLMDAFRKSLKH